jgi:hypothetical protein
MSRIFWTTIAVIGALAIVLFLLVAMLSSSKSRRVQAGWEETIGSPEQVMERFPSRGPNAAALELETLTVEIGIDIATRGSEGRFHPSLEASRRYKRVNTSVGRYLEQQLQQPRRVALPPPEELLDFLDKERGKLTAIRDHLLGSEIPRWEMSLEEQYTTSLPNLLGHINLQKLMIADAMFWNWRGESSEAIDTIEACWKLNGAIREDPYLITQLVAISNARLHAGALRQIEEPPAEWRLRLFEHNYRDSFFDAALLESWGWTRMPDPRLLDDQPGFGTRMAWSLARPYVKYCWADVSDDYRRRLLELNRREAFCDYYGVGREGALDLPVPFWNVMGDIVKGSMAGALDRLARLELELELTGRVLGLGSESWDDRVEQSFVCPEDGWLYETGADGSKSIAFNREISWPEQTGVVLPIRFSIDP